MTALRWALVLPLVPVAWLVGCGMAWVEHRGREEFERMLDGAVWVEGREHDAREAA